MKPRLGVRGKLFVTTLLVIAGAGAVAIVTLHRSTRRAVAERRSFELLRDARVLAEAVAASAPAGPTHGDALADRLGAASGRRVTIVSPSGVLLGDSALPLAQVRGAGPFEDRPEVIAAKAGGSAIVERFSTTGEEQMLFAAAVYAANGGAGVVRLGLSSAALADSMSNVRSRLLIAALAGLVVAAILSAITAHLLSRPIRAMASARRHRGPRVPGDELDNIVGSFNEVNRELQQTVAELAAQQGRFETVLQSMGEALVALDRDRRITLVNPAAVELLDLGSSSIGRDLVHVNRTPALNELARRGCEAPASLEFELPGPPRRRVLARATPLGGAGGTVMVLHDMTEVRRLERIRRDFVANVSHELRTPVSVIRANAETLLDGAIDDRKRGPAFLAAIHRNAERLAQLIADLLDLSRIEAGSYRLTPEPVPIAVAAERAAEEVKTLAEERRIAVAVAIDPDLRVLADEKALDQVLLNLVHNAVKYTDEGGHVTIGATRRPDRVRIEVADDGPGIAPHHRARVFERFYRVDPGRSRDLGGTGLGLAIVKHLVESMHGEAGVDPRRPRGCIFHVTLPLPAPASSETAAPAEAMGA